MSFSSENLWVQGFFSGSFFRSFLTIPTFFTSCLFSIKILFLSIFACRKLSMGATAFLPTGLTSTLSKVSAGCPFSLSSSTFSSFQSVTRPTWAGFKTAEEGIAIIMSYIL
jgi:hypothetical protein